MQRLAKRRVALIIFRIVSNTAYYSIKRSRILRLAFHYTGDFH